MRVHLDELTPERVLEIAGTEPWLDRIYADFPVPSGSEQPRITGTLRLVKEPAGTVHVSGPITYAPFVACSRCDRPIAWPVEARVDLRFFPEVPEGGHPRDRSLTAAELDEYHLEDGWVDVEMVINDAIQTELPSQLLPVEPGSSSCRMCGVDLSEERVWSASKQDGADETRENPFAALKVLKH